LSSKKAKLLEARRILESNLEVAKLNEEKLKSKFTNLDEKHKSEQIHLENIYKGESK
jgi:hypothetical protein